MVLLAHAIALLQSLNKTIHTQIRRRSPKIKAHWCIRIRQLPHQEQGNAGVTGYGSVVTALSVPRYHQRPTIFNPCDKPARFLSCPHIVIWMSMQGW